MHESKLVWVRGAGELGSAAALTLHRTGFNVFASDLPLPLAIRRTVTFSDALIDGSATVEDVRGRHASLEEIPAILLNGDIPIILDDPEALFKFKPNVIVDARMLKRPVEDFLDRAPITIGLGPGFIAGTTCQAVIETRRGHDLGRIIWTGQASPNTGIPGEIGGETKNRIIRALAAGTITWETDFGKLVKKGERIGTINQNIEILAPISGLVRGLISPKVPVSQGMKIGDIDPRGKSVDFLQISDKSLAVARGVLEAILIFHQKTQHE